MPPACMRKMAKTGVLKTPSIRGFIAHVDAPRSMPHTARWRTRQWSAASPCVSRNAYKRMPTTMRME
ncbi:hypothetical protein XAR_0520 [Xanthomonas citri pv. glycines str. 8ra]|nr:hypothetical protein XAR_0520 [Xanthomonas citri pv. glycines str. 8ra]